MGNFVFMPYSGSNCFLGFWVVGFGFWVGLPLALEKFSIRKALSTKNQKPKTKNLKPKTKNLQSPPEEL